MADSQSKLVLSVETAGAVSEVDKLRIALQALNGAVGTTSSSSMDAFKKMSKDAGTATEKLSNLALSSAKKLESQIAKPYENGAKRIKSTQGDILAATKALSQAVLAAEKESADKIIQQQERVNLARSRRLDQNFILKGPAGQLKIVDEMKTLIKAGETLESVTQRYGNLASSVFSDKTAVTSLREQVKWASTLETKVRSLNEAWQNMTGLNQYKTLIKMQDASTKGAGPDQLRAKFGDLALASFNNPSTVSGLAAQYGKLAGATSSATKATQGFSQMSRETHALARGLSGSLNALWMTYGSLMPLLAGAFVGSVSRNIYTTGKDLEYQLKFIEALGNTPININDMMPAVMGSMKTPMEAAEALMALTQAGLSSKQALDALSSTMQLSTFGGLGMEQAATSMTTTLAAFNLGISEASRVGDVFAKAAAVSNTSVEKITESMKQASTAAHQYNISVEEVSAGLAVLAENNITGSAAGTAYRNMIKELYTPIARGAKAFKSLGLSAFDADGKMKPLTTVLQELRFRLAGLTDEARSKTLEALFGERAGRAMRPILDNMDAYIEKTKEMNEAQGFLSEGSSTLMDSVEGDSNRIASALQQTYSKAFESVNSELRNLMSNILKVVQSEGLASAFSGIANGVLTLINGFVNMSPALKGLLAAYVTGRASLMLFNAALGASKSSLLSQANALFRNTQETKANTQAKQANALANKGMEASAASSVSKASAAIGTLGRVVGGFNLVSGVLFTAWAGASFVQDVFTTSSRKVQAEIDRTSNRISVLTGELNAQAEAGRKAFEMRALGGSEDAPREQATTLDKAKQLYETEVQIVEAMKERIRNAEIITTSLEEQKSKTGLTAQETRKLRDQTQLHKNLTEQLPFAQDVLIGRLAQTLSLEQSILGVVRMQMAARMQADSFSRFSSLDQYSKKINDLRAARDSGAKLDQEQLKMLEVGEKYDLDNTLRGLKVSSSRVISHFESTVGGLEAALLSQKALAQSSQKDISRYEEILGNLKLYQQTGDAKGIANLANSDLVSDTVRTAVINAVTGMESFDGSVAARIHNITGELDKAQQAIQSPDLPGTKTGGSGSYKPTRGEKYDNRLNNQAYKLIASTRAEANRAERASVKALNELYDDLNSKYFTEDVNKAIQARNEAEEPFNKLIEDRKTKMEELQDIITRGGEEGSEYTLKQIADAKQQVQQLAETINVLEARKQQAGNIGYAYGLELYKKEFSFSARMREETTRLQDEINKTGYTVADSIIGTFDGMSDALANFVATGEMNIKQFAANTLAELSKMAFKIAANNILMSIFGVFTGGGISGVFGGGLGAGQSLAGPGALSGLSSVGPTLMVNAKGNAFNQGSLTKFAKGGAFTNTIAKGTTVAPMAMFGEAGPEAIMPLTRMSDGSLGIKAIPTGAEGAVSGGNNISVVTNVVVNSDGTSSSDSKTNAAGENTFKQLSEQLASENRRIIEKELRQGGLIYQYVRANK